MLKYIKKYIANPELFFRYILDNYVYLWIISRKKGIDLEGTLILKGMPIVEVVEGATISIGNNVTLRSRNKGHHLNMHSPVKLMADWPGAILSIGSNTRIGGSCIHAQKEIRIGQNCLIAANCQIIDNAGHDPSFPDVSNRINTIGTPKPIIIEDDVWIGANSIITPGVTIGKGSVVAAGSVVVSNILSYSTVIGNPAKLIIRRPPPAEE